MVAAIRPADAVAETVVALEKDRWLKGLVKKTKHPKVRSGCITCKQRRLKCDEAKPHCLRCCKSGRECAGYGSDLGQKSSPPLKAVSVIEAAPQDDQLLSYFLSEATEQLAGFCFALKEFCQSLAPQLGHHYPAVRYALLSVAARTRAATFRWDARRPRSAAIAYKSQALVFYNNAIQHLTSAEVPAEVYLVCGLLFAATEYWPHRHMAPTVHILTAFRLILRGTAMLPETVKESMFPFLVFMGRKTLAFADAVPEDLAAQMRVLVWLTIRPPDLPLAFRSSNEAWSHMDTFVNFVGAFSHDDRKFTIQARTHALCYATEMQNALLHTASLVHPDDQHHQTQYRALLMHHRAMQVMLDAALVGPGDETIYDLFTADFEHILYECEALLNSPQHATDCGSPHSRNSTSPSPPPRKVQPWDTSLGFLAPLFFVATRCRIPSFRHRAIKALHASRRREREWNSCIATMLARFVVRSETQHACAAAAEAGVLHGGMMPSANGTISEEHRICLKNVAFDRDKQVMQVEYVHPRTGEEGTRMLEWRVDAAGGIDDDFECVMISSRHLKMNGYCGIMLVTPPIGCQCGGGEQSRVHPGGDGRR